MWLRGSLFDLRLGFSSGKPYFSRRYRCSPLRETEMQRLVVAAKMDGESEGGSTADKCPSEAARAVLGVGNGDGIEGVAMDQESAGDVARQSGGREGARGADGFCEVAAAGGGGRGCGCGR